MSAPLLSPLKSVEAQLLFYWILYTKASRAELERSYDDAFSLYVRAAQSYLYWAKNDPNARARERCKQEAKKCLDRAELIKRSKKELKPLAKDPFSHGNMLLVSSFEVTEFPERFIRGAALCVE